MAVGIYESGTPDQKMMRSKFRAIIRAAFTPEEIRRLAHVADVGMLPDEHQPPRSAR